VFDAVVDECGECGGDGSSCGTDVYLSLSGGSLLYDSTSDIYGFQFNHDGCASDAFGGDAEAYGFTVSASSSVVLAFSFSGSFIPAGSGTLLDGVDCSTITDLVFSGSTGDSLTAELLECEDGYDCAGIPLEFAHNPSELKASYSFITVTIDGESVASNDWVGAFNGDICVGAKKWDTSLCEPGVCNIQVMGNDLSTPGTEGYMLSNQIPSFKVFDYLTYSLQSLVCLNHFP
jgi:hypothetical protein